MIYLFLAFCICSLDLFMKKQIEAQEDAAFPIHLEGGFTLEKHHNYGFALNRFDRHPKLVKAVSCFAFFPFLVWTVRLFAKKSGDLGKLGAAFLIGGAASNLHDRFFRGYVVDYLRLPNRAGKKSFRHIRKIRNIIFNIADFFIFLGGILTAIYGIFSK